ncbi:hypothetical protein SAMN05444156_0454 [Verrucomicrobium sp. GAS474]|uniref:hypothetical protein n=1 Tax=Verrucomicrobium sp. GAS474 TaxID=1882831 RepID=UPI00087C69E7|nr:hypothetical protein [Verrucomicrobium sp. GAS474]SDT88886.1 hypothetical protein SAMN05444156_0454 [Verrucomicrobium sp. GAS474]
MNAKLKLLSLVLTLSAITAFAGDGNNDPKDFHHSLLSQNVQPDYSYFRANEWQVDAFGAYAVAGSGVINSGGGGGAGVNYFFSRYIGLGLEGSGFDGGSTVDTVSSATLNLIARYPIESLHIAPYAFIGAGGNFMTNDEQATGDLGVGVEWRFTRNWGIFTDARYVVADDTNNYGLARLGVRFAY